MRRVLLKNGTCVSGDKSIVADILIQDEKIKEIKKDIKVDKNTQVIDCKGKLIFAGFIDGHTHLQSFIGGTWTADDFENGTKAAISGGTTTIVDYGAGPLKGESLNHYYGEVKARATNHSYCDFGIHMSITDWNDDIKKEIKDILSKGVTSFKLYTTYASMLNDEELFSVMQELAKYNALVTVHCENNGIIAKLRKDVSDKDKNKVSNHYKTRPDISEAVEVNKLIGMANLTKCPFLCVHITAKKAFDELIKAKKDNKEIYTETCPQYILFNDSVYDKNFNEAVKYVCAPPIRKKEDNKALIDGIKNKTMDIISTDHCSFTMKQKEVGKNDYTKIPGGVNMIEHRPLVIYQLVTNKTITKERMAQVLSENPAKLFGLYDKKGFIKKGYDADLVILDPKKNTTYSAKTQYSKSDYSLLEGKKMKGSIEKVFLRGELIVDNNKVLDTMKGQYLKRKNYTRI